MTVDRAFGVYQRRGKSDLHKSDAKPVKKQTKKEVKFKLDDVTKEIKAGNVVPLHARG